jgi:putative oxidoreductase
MTPALWSFLSLAGRIGMSAIFLIAGVGKIQNWSGTAAHMEAAGIPAASLLLPLTVVAEIGGGLALLVGWQTRWAALGLFLFLIPATLIFHHFWDLLDPEQSMQRIHFLKNLAIMGGLLEFSAMGAGGFSLDALSAKSALALPSFAPKSQQPA